mmetsp:Transcript_44074/g.103464  ORF Transcript_44074/g.103464 Transcript_44074/m.103464 type:complete len:217 (+) Transcript_44074:2315-2965(+)
MLVSVRMALLRAGVPALEPRLARQRAAPARHALPVGRRAHVGLPVGVRVADERQRWPELARVAQLVHEVDPKLGGRAVGARGREHADAPVQLGIAEYEKAAAGAREGDADTVGLAHDAAEVAGCGRRGAHEAEQYDLGLLALVVVDGAHAHCGEPALLRRLRKRRPEAEDGAAAAAAEVDRLPDGGRALSDACADQRGLRLVGGEHDDLRREDAVP